MKIVDRKLCQHQPSLNKTLHVQNELSDTDGWLSGTRNEESEDMHHLID